MNKCYYRILWENYPSDKTPLNEQNLNKIDVATDEMDNRIITLDSTKFDKSEAQLLVKYIEYDEDTGIFTVTHYNGAKYTIDTLLEKLAINFDYNYQTQRLIIQLSDGTVKYVDLSALLTQYEFLDSDTVTFTVDNSGKVTAKIKDGSIQEKHLNPNYLADVKVEVAKAKSSADNASEKAKEAYESAILSKSYSDGNTGTRDGENTDNAKYYSEKAKEALKILESSGNVVSVNGQTGVVTLGASDVGAISKTGDTMTGNLVVENGGIVVQKLGNGFYVRNPTNPDNQIGLAISSDGARGIVTPTGGFILSVDLNDNVVLHGTATNAISAIGATNAVNDYIGRKISDTYALKENYNIIYTGIRITGCDEIKVLETPYINVTTFGNSYEESGDNDFVAFQNQAFTPYSTSGIVKLGTPAKKWGQIYSTNSVIATSDRKEKKDIAFLDNELTIKFIMGLIPKMFKFINGTSGRVHYGFIAQDVEKLLEELGISSLDFAGFIKSPKTKTTEKEIEREVEKDGKIVIEKSIISEDEIIEGEYTYGLRYEEFISLSIKMEQIIYELYMAQNETIQKQNETIQNLLDRIELIEKHLNLT